MEEFLMLIVETFADDPTRPGITLSYLGGELPWYASVCRYTEPYGKGKIVVCTSHAQTLDDALSNLQESFLKWRETWTSTRS